MLKHVSILLNLLKCGKIFLIQFKAITSSKKFFSFSCHLRQLSANQSNLQLNERTVTLCFVIGNSNFAFYNKLFNKVVFVLSIYKKVKTKLITNNVPKNSLLFHRLYKIDFQKILPVISYLKVNQNLPFIL